MEGPNESRLSRKTYGVIHVSDCQHYIAVIIGVFSIRYILSLDTPTPQQMSCIHFCHALTVDESMRLYVDIKTKLSTGSSQWRHIYGRNVMAMSTSILLSSLVNLTETVFELFKSYKSGILLSHPKKV